MSDNENLPSAATGAVVVGALLSLMTDIDETGAGNDAWWNRPQ